MNNPLLNRLQQQMSALIKYNREQRQKRDRDLLLRLKQTK